MILSFWNLAQFAPIRDRLVRGQLLGAKTACLAIDTVEGDQRPGGGDIFQDVTVTGRLYLGQTVQL